MQTVAKSEVPSPKPQKMPKMEKRKEKEKEKNAKHAKNAKINPKPPEMTRHTPKYPK
jgi:hypothetical protein